MLESPGFQFTFWLRLVAWLRIEPSLIKVLRPLARLVKRHLSYKYGISIPASTQIGPGFYIGHFGGIVVSKASTIGSNCNISQGVTLGQANRGQRAGAPSIGDNVYIGPGAKVVGRVHVGSNVAIGANAVVTSDVPDNAVVAGVPAKVLSYEGSAGYVNRTDYSILRP
jgi:serine O-acetyltransferase